MQVSVTPNTIAVPSLKKKHFAMAFGGKMFILKLEHVPIL